MEVEQFGLGASAYLSVVHGVEDGYPVGPDVSGELRLCELLAQAAQEGAILSAHDCSEGGLLVALAEIALAGGIQVELPAGAPGDLFAEIPGRVVVGCESLEPIVRLSNRHRIAAHTIGTFGASTGVYLGGDFSETWTQEELVRAYEGSIPRLMAESG